MPCCKTLVFGCRAGALHVFEDLSGVSFQNLEDRNASRRYELRSWTFYSLEMKTAYKATMRRGAILKVNPQYTSQKCPGCGTIDKTVSTADASRKKWGCRISKYFLLGGSPALCPNGIEIGHVFDAILYKRSSFPGIPFGMPYFRLFCFQLSKSMPFLMEKDNFPFFRSESCNGAY